MNKTLGLIAAAGLVLCGIFVGLAYGVSGGKLGPFEPFSNLFADDKPGPTGTRQWTLSGDSLEIDAPAIIRVSGPASGPTTLIVRGPQKLLDDMRFNDGRLNLDSDEHIFMHNQHLEITIQGTVPKNFILNGFGKLELGHLDQDSLTVRISGANAQGEGRADNLDASISAAQVMSVRQAGGKDRAYEYFRRRQCGNFRQRRSRCRSFRLRQCAPDDAAQKLVSHISGLGHVHNPDGHDAGDSND